MAIGDYQIGLDAAMHLGLLLPEGLNLFSLILMRGHLNAPRSACVPNAAEYGARGVRCYNAGLLPWYLSKILSFGGEPNPVLIMRREMQRRLQLGVSTSSVQGDVTHGRQAKLAPCYQFDLALDRPVGRLLMRRLYSNAADIFIDLLFFEPTISSCVIFRADFPRLEILSREVEYCLALP